MKVAARTLPLALAAVLLLAPADAAAGKPANSIVATATNVTPAESVGSSIYVRIEGRVTAPSGSRDAKNCRSGRQVEARNLLAQPPGLLHREYFNLASRKGRFSATSLRYDYTDPSDPIISGDIGPAGGALTIEVYAAPLRLNSTKLGKINRCRALSDTVQVQVAPAPVD